VLIVASVGIAFLAIAWLMYRRRKLETAGDFIAVKWIKPIFLLLYTLCAGAFLSLFSALFGQVGWIMLVLGLLIGYFTGSMLLERTIRVFKKKNFLRLAIITVVALLAVGAAKLDVLGIVRYIPEREDIAYIQLQKYGDERIFGDEPFMVEMAEKVRTVHTFGVETQCDGNCSQKVHDNFYIEYHLKNGMIVRRQYKICYGSKAYHLIPTIQGFEYYGEE
jgi:ABC-2 type transport system permease protein